MTQAHVYFKGSHSLGTRELGKDEVKSLQHKIFRHEDKLNKLESV
jgi:hypothetical protein